MELLEYLALIKKKKQTILSVILLFLIVTVGFTFVQPLEYASEAKIIIIQKFGEGVDPYNASKSNEYLSTVLSKVIETNSFYNEVMNSGFDINKNYFPADIEKQIKKWRKTVSAKPVGDSGMITLTVLHKDKYQSDQIIRGVNHVIQSKHGLYHGNGESVTVKTIDQPFTASWPAKPNIPLNIAMGFALSIIFSLSFIYLFPEKNFKLSPKRRMKEELPSPEQVGITANPNVWLGNQEFAPVYAQAERPEAAGVRSAAPSNLPLHNREEAQDDLSYDEVIRSGNMQNLFGRSNPQEA